jgi:hypothetical protein
LPLCEFSLARSREAVKTSGRRSHPLVDSGAAGLADALGEAEVVVGTDRLFANPALLAGFETGECPQELVDHYGSPPECVIPASTPMTSASGISWSRSTRNLLSCVANPPS